MTEIIEATKDVDQVIEESVQPRARGAQASGFVGLLNYLVQGGSYRVAPWWSPKRDEDLSAFMKSSDPLMGTVAMLTSKVVTVPVRVLPRDTALMRHQREAEEFTIRLNEYSEYGAGFPTALSKWLEDWFCLAGPTRIHLGGKRLGQTKRIAKMVKDKDVGPVLSLDENGHLVEKPVVDWHKSPLGSRKWWWISLQDASYHVRSERGGIFVTDDHPILTKEGWKPACEVEVGMLVATGDPVPNSTQSQMLAGTLLGDGSMSKVRKRSLLRFAHSVKQEAWFNRKLEALRGFQWTGKNYRSCKAPNSEKESHSVAINSRASLGLNYWYNEFYPEGKKIIPRELVEENFSPLMLATWFLDDGSMSCITPGCYTVNLYTNGFRPEDVQWLADLLTENGIPSKMYMIVDGKYPIIGVSAEGSRRLMKTIGSYVPPCMRYKVAHDAPEFDPATWELGKAQVYWDTVAVSRQRDYRGGNSYYEKTAVQTAYCLSVEETQNFIAAQTVVHNCSDNGAYFEVIGGGDKDGPIEGASEGVAHLDSHRCTRTGDPNFPVIYRSPQSGTYKLHRTRVAFASDEPSPREEMLGVGTCSVSRTLQAAQNLMDIANYKMEKLGSRPLRAMMIAKGITADAVMDALAISNEMMDSQNLQIFSKIALLADLDTDAAIELLNLISLPDGFDEDTSTRLGMFAIALGFGVPIRWIYPASVSGATKADAMYQHIAGLGGGIGRVLKTLTMLLGGDPRGQRHAAGKFLPPHLKLVFDFQDDEQDRNQAEIQDKRATTRNANLETGVIDTRVAREQALMDADLTQAQFDYLEREDGRLPGGASILSLFHTTKKPYFEWLDLGVPNPLAVSANDPIDMLTEINRASISIQDVLANSTRALLRKQAQESLAGLSSLKTMYAPLAQQSIQQEIMQRFRTPAAPMGEGEETETPAPETEESAKVFDYGVSVGEVITGELARGAGGQFINKDELMAQIRAGMLDRMRAAGGTNSAGDARAGNRAEVAEKLGMTPEQLEALAGMKTGETSLEMEQVLAEMGLAKENPDGSISMTSGGRSLLAAANSGDVDKAEEALAKAQAPDAGKPGAKPKDGKPKDEGVEKGPEQVRKDNRAEVAKEISDRIDLDDFEGLVDFGKGLDLDVDRTRRLAQAGLIEVGPTGESRLTRAGSALLSAADKGDVRGAKDTLSQARESVIDTMARAEQARQEADQAMDSVQELAQKNTEQLNQVMADTQRTLEKNELRAEQVMVRADRRAEDKEQKATKLDAKADEVEAKANETDAKIDVLTAELETAVGDEADYLARKIEILRGQSDSTWERARLARQDADDARDDAGIILREAQLRVGDLAQDSRDAVEKANQRAGELQAQVDTAAEKAQGRQEQLRAFAKQLEDSVGGGVASVSAPEPREVESPTEEPATASISPRLQEYPIEAQEHALGIVSSGVGDVVSRDDAINIAADVAQRARAGMSDDELLAYVREQYGQKGWLQSLAGKVANVFGTKEKVEPSGEPLELWPEDRIVPITRGDIEAANQGWNENPELPDRSKGILEARQAGVEEIADAIAKGHGK